MAEISLSISSSEAKGMRHLFGKLLFFLPILTCVGLTNFFVDPAHVYRSAKFVEGIADIILAGRNAAIEGKKDFNERLVQKRIIEHQQSVPDVIAIGSSRTMQIGAHIFPAYNFRNHAVSAAAWGDYLGILYNYDKKGVLPKRVILGLDPWNLNSNFDDFRWLFFKDDAFAMSKKIGVDSWNPKVPLIPIRWENLFSLSYFKASIKSVFDKDVDKIYPTDEETADPLLILKDGSHVYDKVYRSRPVEIVTKEAKDTVLNVNTYEYNHHMPNANLGRALEKLIVYLQSRNTDVVFFFSPYHPIVYKSFIDSPQKKIIVDIEDYYRDLAKEHHIKTIGSYDPARYGLTEKDFYDPAHANREAVNKIFQESL